MSKRDYYEVLGVSKASTEQEIKKSYRQLARKYHPDVSKEENAEKKFKEIQEAYDVLSDSSKKSTYDQFGHDAANSGFRGQSGFGGGFEDINDIFSSMFGGGSRSNRNGPMRGEDLTLSINITFEEAVFGTSKIIEFQQDKECTDCSGTGAYSKKDITICSQCKGKGKVIKLQQSFFGRVQTEAICDKCNGTGKEVTKKCNTCHGQTYTRKTIKEEVKIPEGIDSGQELRLHGKGNRGRNNGPYGDLYLRINIIKNKHFRREGIDIIFEYPITFSQAVLGDKVKIPTIRGNIEMTLPAGTQSGAIFRLKGKGVKDLRSNRKGVQHVIINVVTPKKISNEQKKLFTQLSKTDEKGTSSIWEKLNPFKK